MSAASLRLDKWLWYARMARTRSLAARLCEAGRVSLDGAPVLKPHHPVRVGDRLTVVQGRSRRSLVVLALGDHRGPAPAARLLYDEPDAPVAVAENEPAWAPLVDEEWV